MMLTEFLILLLFDLEFPKAVMKLLKNPVYMLLNLTSVFEMVIVTGFITFVPKYLETQFDLRTSEANLYTGRFSASQYQRFPLCIICQ